MITVQWRVAYMEGSVRKETRLTITGNSYSDVSYTYLDMLSAFEQVLVTELVGYKEEKEQLPWSLLHEEIN